MTRRQRLRNVAILCCHFLRNSAFYRSGWRNGRRVFREQFWVNANGNFLDIAVLEWCKLFADQKSKHHWRKVVTDQDQFLNGLLATLEITEAELSSYGSEMRTYRDKFVAHLDEEPRANIPRLKVAKASVVYLYDHLLANEEENGCFHDAPASATAFYQRFEREGRRAYRECET